MNDPVHSTNHEAPQQSALPTEAQAYHMDLGGIISLLSQHLYSQGIDVIVRELLQNAVDAITERRLAEPDHAGLIEIECQVQSDSGEMVLSISDDGAGISPEEITRALGTIGFSMKRDGWRDDEGPFIGRFGVGLLSGFIAADEIHVISRKCDENSPSFRWTGHRSGTWKVHPLDDDLSAGTRVYLHLDPEKASQLPPDRVRELAKRFGEYLPGKMVFRNGEGDEILNREPFWEKAGDEETLLRLGKDVFDSSFLGAFRFECEEARAAGIAFIGSRATAPGSEPRHQLYVRRMLVGDQIRGLAPESTPYLRCLVNADALKVNAAREDLHGEETRREDLRKAVGEAFDDYLKRLRKESSGRLRDLAMTHHECLVNSAETNRFHLDLLAGTIPLKTTLGQQTAAQIVRRHGDLDYVTTEKDFLRVELKADQEGQCVTRGTDMLSNRLLSLLRRRSREGQVKEISASEFLARFQTEETQLGADEARLLKSVNQELEPDRCEGEFEDGEDPFSPATLQLDDEESIFRHLAGDDWENEEDDEEKSTRAPKQLVLNRTHPVVERLLESRDLPAALVRAWIRVFFQHALLAARERPTVAESRRHSRALTVIWESGTTLEL